MHRSKVLPPRGATKEFEPIARNRFDYRWGSSFLRFTNHYCVDELLFCRRHIAGRSESNGCRAVIGRLAYLDQRPCSRLAEEQDQLETRSADWAGGGGEGVKRNTTTRPAPSTASHRPFYRARNFNPLINVKTIE